MTVTADAVDAGLLRFSEGGFIGTGGSSTRRSSLQVRHSIPILTDRDLARVPIVERGGESRLEDVADVVIDTPPLMGDGVINDGPGLLLVVQKLPWANTEDVTAGLDEAIAGPPGIRMDPTIFRRPPSSTSRSRTSQRDHPRSMILGSTNLLADRADQHHRDPPVAGRRGTGPVLARGHDQHHGPGGTGDRPRRHRRRRDHRYRERGSPPARTARDGPERVTAGSSSRRPWRCAARSSTPR